MDKKIVTIGSKLTPEQRAKYMQEWLKRGWSQSEFVLYSAEFFYEYLINGTKGSSKIGDGYGVNPIVEDNAISVKPKEFTQLRQPAKVVYLADFSNPERIMLLSEQREALASVFAFLLIFGTSLFKS